MHVDKINSKLKNYLEMMAKVHPGKARTNKK